MGSGPIVQLCRLHPERDADLPLPRYMTEGAAGMDVVAANTAPQTIQAGARALIPTGLSVAIPSGYEIQVRPRSGLALKTGVTVANAPGTIDADYRGEVGIILINLGTEDFVVERGSRVAQWVVAPAPQAILEVVEALPGTERGQGGFGHTGA